MLKERCSDFDRRSGIEKRKIYDLEYFLTGGTEKRIQNERRSNEERRTGWIKISKYSAVFLDGMEDIVISC